ncbi:MAG: DedA family protein [Ignavibacterium sp.]|nr:DedA family protein [Ignavibacterium sp.]
MFEEILNSMSTFNPLWVYVVLLVIPFVENIFPPSPSDFIVVLGGTLIVTNTVDFIPSLVLTTIGSEIGFLTLYFLGSQTDKRLVRKGKVKFISVEALDTAEAWFTKYGFFIILFNRFIPGLRSVISFFAGLSELEFKKTLILSTISAVLWNLILLGLGIFFAENLQFVDYILRTYTTVVFTLLGLAVAVFLLKYLISKRKVK